MKFTLTFEGRLTTNPNAQKKHELRRYFHPQLKRLWEVHPLLARWQHPVSEFRMIPMKDHIPSMVSQLPNYTFVPLVTVNHQLECALNIRLLRRTDVGDNQFDIDNLTKPLWDALKKPNNQEQLGGALEPLSDETPFFVLLEDDSLITKLTSVSDEILEPPKGVEQFDRNHVRVWIEVLIRPQMPAPYNVIFFDGDAEVWDHKIDVPENLAALSNPQLKALTTQYIYRIIAVATARKQQQAAERASIFRPDDFAKQNRRLLENSEFWRSHWRSSFHPAVFSLKKELQRRVYGEGPYPESSTTAIDHGSLAGVSPLFDAATELESLIRSL